MDNSAPIDYLPRIKSYYVGLGYGKPYEWARVKDVPFTHLKKKLAVARIGIVTTASLFDPANGDQGPSAPYNGKAKFFSCYAKPISPFPDVRISHIAIDRAHTTASDIASYFPLDAMLRLSVAGYIGSVSSNFYGLPTNRSQHVTMETDCPKLLSLCQLDDVDAVVMVPNCPVCHQSMALASVHLEAAGIPTVIMGCAKDVIEYVGAPRLLFNDLPLGNGAGLPHDQPSQDVAVKMAVDLLIQAKAPRKTQQSPLIWSGAADWKKDYANIDLLSDAEIDRCRAEFDNVKKDAAELKAAL